MNHTPDYPNDSKGPGAVISGPSQAEGIARFGSRARYEDLTSDRRERLKVSVLDSLACAINALGAPPLEACRAQVDEFSGPGGRCTLIGGGRSNPIDAAFYNTALVRYVDFMDSYLAAGGLCHPSDNLAAILAASEYANLSGKDFLTALAVAYQVESRLTASVPFMAHGFDLTTQLSFSLAAGLSNALGLDEAKATSAVGICGDVIPLLCVRTTPISQWKGLSWIDPAKVERIENDTSQDAYDFMGGGSFGPKTNVHTKEDADHSLPYLLAVALTDGDVQPTQLEAARIAKPDVQTLLRKVLVKPDAGFTARYPLEAPSRVTVYVEGGKSYTHEVSSYPGFSSQPFTWDEVGAKFDNLVGPRADGVLRRDIKSAVRSLESIQVSELMGLLAKVRTS